MNAQAQGFEPSESLASNKREFGEFGGVNASVENSTTFTVLHANTMPEIFSGAKNPENGTPSTFAATLGTCAVPGVGLWAFNPCLETPRCKDQTFPHMQGPATSMGDPSTPLFDTLGVSLQRLRARRQDTGAAQAGTCAILLHLSPLPQHLGNLA